MIKFNPLLRCLNCIERLHSPGLSIWSEVANRNHGNCGGERVKNRGRILPRQSVTNQSFLYLSAYTREMFAEEDVRIFPATRIC